MDSSPWKAKLSNEQLERKRLHDKNSRRRSRLGSKQAEERQRQRFITLLEKEKCNFLHRLVAENTRLLEIHEHCQSKIESLLHWSQDCLDFTGDPCLSLMAGTAAGTSSSIPRADQRSPNDFENLDSSSSHCDAFESSQNAGDVLSANKSYVPPHPSIIFQIHLTLRSQEVNMQPSRSANDLIESILTWKMAKGEPLQSNSLIAYFALDGAPFYLTQNDVKSAISLTNFYESLHRGLYHGDPIPVTSPEEGSLETFGSMSRLAQEQRSLAYLSYVRLEPHRKCFVGLPEYLGAYWVVYTFVTFLTFPTETNMKKIPAWLQPMASQFENDHPGNIDFIVWPMMREKLARTWTNYDVRILIQFILENYELASFPGKLGSEQLQLKPDASDLEAAPAFREGIFDIRNYTIKEPFRKRYPELTRAAETTGVLRPENTEMMLGYTPANDLGCGEVDQDNATALAEDEDYNDTSTITFTLGDENRQSLNPLLDASASSWADFPLQYPEFSDSTFADNGPGPYLLWTE